tara:strand:- start:119 stop:1147 length:1029 start_codon:yes stop_codon:yes gene_type:complete
MKFKLSDRSIGDGHPPLVIAEIGINHEGQIDKAIKMVDDAASMGCECVKFQCHVIDDEMVPNDVIPGNADESIWDIMSRCALTEQEEIYLKDYVHEKGLIYLSTPFSRAAADRLEKMNVEAYKIGSGECNNYPLIEHIASFNKPIILSTGMNNISSIKPAVQIFDKYNIPYALLHCTSMYPTPYEKVRLGALNDLKNEFPEAIIGLSDHSMGNFTCFAAVSMGAKILEKHFTSDKTWDGPDVPISLNPDELKDLVIGATSIFKALGGSKDILKEEKPTIDFAYACVVSINKIKKGEILSKDNIWVKRPGTGEIKAKDYEKIIGKKSLKDIDINKQLNWSDFE